MRFFLVWRVWGRTGNGFAGGENGKVLDIGRKMQCMGVQEWKITGFGKGVL